MKNNLLTNILFALMLGLFVFLFVFDLSQPEITTTATLNSSKSYDEFDATSFLTLGIPMYNRIYEFELTTQDNKEITLRVSEDEFDTYNEGDVVLLRAKGGSWEIIGRLSDQDAAIGTSRLKFFEATLFFICNFAIISIK